MNNLLPIVASGHSFTFFFRVALFLLLIFFVGLLIVETISFIQLFDVEVLQVPPVLIDGGSPLVAER